MRVYTSSEATQQLAFLLELAQKEGIVCIRQNGKIFSIQPMLDIDSPLNIESVPLNLTSEEIVGFVREGRER